MRGSLSRCRFLLLLLVAAIFVVCAEEQAATASGEEGTPAWMVAAAAAVVLVVVAVVAMKAMGGKGEVQAAPEPVSMESVCAEPEGEPMTILFGSQSGTAEGFAFDLEKEAKQFGFAPKVVDLEEYDHETDLSGEAFVLFLMATFGEGEPTDSSVAFNDWLMDKELDADMSSVKFAVFGLGNRQYEHFCEMGRRVSTRMKELGAAELLEAGEGDDDGSLDDDFESWKSGFWRTARAEILGETGGAELKEAPITPFETEYTIEMLGRNSGTDSKVPPVSFDSKYEGAFAPVLVNKELRQSIDDGGSTRHVELDISSLELKYKTADNLGVLPHNDYKLAGRMARRLEVDPKAFFKITPTCAAPRHKLSFPSPCKVEDALLWHCDICAVPKRSVLEFLYCYATDAGDKAKLHEWMHDGKAAFNADQMSLLEVLEALPSCTPPFVELLQWVPKLQPRFYTISSSSMTHPDSIHITVSLARQEKPRGREHLGICSTFLCGLKPTKDLTPVFVRDSGFRPPWEKPEFQSKACPPVIMVGPGTGVAPFRAFVHEAAMRKQQGQPLGELVLYFGCKKQTQDYIYKDELERFDMDNVLDRYRVAFSREQKDKVYVQHLLREDCEHIWDLVHNKGAYFYVCGGTSMGRDIRDEVMSMAQRVGGFSAEEAAALLKKLQDTGRYVQELWS